MVQILKFLALENTFYRMHEHFKTRFTERMSILNWPYRKKYTEDTALIVSSVGRIKIFCTMLKQTRLIVLNYTNLNYLPVLSNRIRGIST